MLSVRQNASEMQAGRRPDTVLKTMQDPRRGSQLGQKRMIKMCLEEELCAGNQSLSYFKNLSYSDLIQNLHNRNIKTFPL